MKPDIVISAYMIKPVNIATHHTNIKVLLSTKMMALNFLENQKSNF